MGVGFTCPVTPPPLAQLLLAACTALVLTAGCAIVPTGISSAPPAASGAATVSTSGARATTAASTPASPDASASASATASPEPVDCTKVACVALTFDDGPGEQTGALLDTLVRARAPAAFFLVGTMIRQEKAMARRIAATPGMTIANHTITHPMLTRIPAASARREIVQNSRLIEQVTGVKPRFFRPPYGLHNSAIDAVARSLGQSVVLWSAGALDWEYDKPAKIVEATLPQIAPGAIVLAHDIHPWTIKAVPSLIAKLRAKGYSLVSLDDILGPARPGKTYVRGRH